VFPTRRTGSSGKRGGRGGKSSPRSSDRLASDRSHNRNPEESNPRSGGESGAGRSSPSGRGRPRRGSGSRPDPRKGRPDSAPGRPAGGRGRHNSVAGSVSYNGMLRGGHLIVGLFDRRKAGKPLAYWVNLEEPGEFILDGMEPGDYELHGCMATRINGEGMPVDVLATGSWERAKSIRLPSDRPLSSCDFDVYDEIPVGLIHGIDTVFIEVNEMDRAVRFYRDMLGLSIIVRDENWTEFDCGSTILALQRKREVPKGRRPIKNVPHGGTIVFRVENLSDTRQELIERGVDGMGRIVDLPLVRWATFEDLDGNRLQIFERKAQ